MSKLNQVAPVSDARFGSLPPPTRDAAPKEPPPPSAELPDVRLVIEEDDRTGAFVYKTLDRRTGQVIQQFPREEILRLQREKDYSAGDVISQRA